LGNEQVSSHTDSLSQEHAGNNLPRLFSFSSRRHQNDKSSSLNGNLYCMAYSAFACRMYDVLYRPTEVILVLEFLDCNLRELLRGAGPLSVVLAKSFTHQILQGLAYAKSKRCIHRDLKPANILVLPTRGIVKIADFGLSRSHDFAGGRYSRQVMFFPC
jgi:serine/threonine protein kinase